MERRDGTMFLTRSSLGRECLNEWTREETLSNYPGAGAVATLVNDSGVKVMSVCGTDGLNVLLDRLERGAYRCIEISDRAESLYTIELKRTNERKED